MTVVTIFQNLKTSVLAALIFAGDAARRRAIASLFVAVALHYGGAAFDVEHIDTLIALMVPAAAAWSKNTPKLPDPEPGEIS